MTLSLADLPFDVREAYLGSVAKPEEIESLRQLGAAAVIEAVAIVDSANATMYLTRDSGQSFDVEKIAESVPLKGNQSDGGDIVVRRVIKISQLPN